MGGDRKIQNKTQVEGIALAVSLTWAFLWAGIWPAK